MPQLDILIWLNLVINTTFYFWVIYYILMRLFLLNYQFILNLRLKFKNSFFTMVYVILLLIFQYNFQSIKVFVKNQIHLQKKNNTVYFFFCKCINSFYFLLSLYIYNLYTANYNIGAWQRQLYYIISLKRY